MSNPVSVPVSPTPEPRRAWSDPNADIAQQIRDAIAKAREEMK